LIEKFKEFQKEVHIMSQLNHPNLVKLFGISLNPISLILEFIEGRALHKYLYNVNEYELSWLVRLRIAQDIARGLSIMHTMDPPIVHRDLRSPNIFVLSIDEHNEGKYAVIGDFGLSHFVSPKFNELLQTWQWMAPEAIDYRKPNLNYDEKSDIYSLGVVFWEITARSTPFDEFDSFVTKETKNIFGFSEERIEELQNGGFIISEDKKTAYIEKVNKHLAIEQIVDKDLRPNIPPETPQNFERLIQSCWLRDPDLRPKAEEIYDLLGNIIRNLDSNR